MIPVLSSSVLSSNKPQSNLNYDPHCPRHKHDMRLISDGRDKKFKNYSHKKQQNLLYIHISVGAPFSNEDQPPACSESCLAPPAPVEIITPGHDTSHNYESNSINKLQNITRARHTPGYVTAS